MSKGQWSHQNNRATLSAGLLLGLLVLVRLANSIVWTTADLAATAAAAYLRTARKPLVRRTVSIALCAVVVLVIAGQTQDPLYTSRAADACQPDLTIATVFSRFSYVAALQ